MIWCYANSKMDPRLREDDIVLLSEDSFIFIYLIQ